MFYNMFYVYIVKCFAFKFKLLRLIYQCTIRLLLLPYHTSMKVSLNNPSNSRCDRQKASNWDDLMRQHPIQIPKNKVFACQPLLLLLVLTDKQFINIYNNLYWMNI